MRHRHSIRQTLAYAPPWWALYKPSYLIRRKLFRQVREFANNCSGTVLDFGCGRKPYKFLFSHCHDYVPVDYVDTKKKYYAYGEVLAFDGLRIPLSDASVDDILCTEVLEHVFTPSSVLAELFRVLRPGGTMLITVPFIWEEHDVPHDFARYTRFGIRYLVEQAGFSVMHIRREGDYVQALAQLICTYICGCFVPANRILGRITELLLIAPVNILGLAVSRILPGSKDLYLSTVLLVKKSEVIV